MGKPALGKGMKDLLAKNIGMTRKEPSKDKVTIEQELKINIERYQAQDFNVTLLKKLEGLDEEAIHKGVEEYREAIKKLNSAQTVVRSLEGYGYSDELESIMKIIKDPASAKQVLAQVEDLRERALSEHNVKVEKKESPRVKLPKGLKEQSEKLSQMEEGDDINLDSLDGMLSDLNDIGDAFSLEMEEADPVLEKIEAWESEGFFVDNLKALINEDRTKAEKEMKVFEQGVKEMRKLKERFRKMDLSDEFSKQKEEIKIKFQYPHMTSEIKNELDAIDKKIDDDLKASMPQEEPPVEEEAPVEPKIPVEETVQKELPEEQPEPAIEETPVKEAPPEPVPVVPAEEEASSKEAFFPDLSLDELMDKAKEVYRDGDLEQSLKCFHEILNRDPDNSKARFMIRRLSAKQ